MKRIVFSLLVLLVVISTACNQGSKSNSQPSSGPGDFNTEAFVDRQVEQLNEALDFTDKQEKEIRVIITKGMDDMMKMREEMQSGNGDREGMREHMQEMRGEQNKKVQEILSEEQWTKYQSIEKERRGQRGQGRQGGGQGRPE